MACVEWGNLSNGGKMKTKTEVYGKVVIHNDKDERLDHNHKNIHIDKSKTPLNFSCGGFTGHGVYELFCKRLEGVTVRNKDTVLLNSAIVYAPQGLEGDVRLCSDWMMDVYGIAKDQFGENVLDMQVDFDEVHKYTVPKTKEERMSLVHGHLRLQPILNGAMNNNAVVTRGAIKIINDAIEKMTQEKYHVPWNTGEGKHSKNQTVEYMKNASLAAENEVLTEEKSELEAKKSGLEADCERLEERQEKAEELGEGFGLAVSVVNGTRRRIRKETEKADDAEEQRKKTEAAAKGARDMLEAIRTAQAREIEAHNKAMAEGREELSQLQEDIKTARVDAQAAHRAQEAYKAALDGKKKLDAEIDSLTGRRDRLKSDVEGLTERSEAIRGAKKAVSKFVAGARHYVPDELKFSRALLAVMACNKADRNSGPTAVEGPTR